MHNHSFVVVPHAPGRPRLRRYSAALTLMAALALTACVPREHDLGNASRLPVGEPYFKEYKGANLYMLRGADDGVTVFWGMSPFEPDERGKIRCFIQDRRDRVFRGETRPFVDPCRSAWWSRDGHFLGYSDDPAEAPASGPDLVQIPAQVRDGRVRIDEARLRCLQTQGCR